MWHKVSKLGDLKDGDRIRHVRNADLYGIVTGNYGVRVTAVQSLDMNNADEWMVWADGTVLHNALGNDIQAKQSIMDWDGIRNQTEQQKAPAKPLDAQQEGPRKFDPELEWATPTADVERNAYELSKLGWPAILKIIARQDVAVHRLKRQLTDMSKFSHEDRRVMQEQLQYYSKKSNDLQTRLDQGLKVIEATLVQVEKELAARQEKKLAIENANSDAIRELGVEIGQIRRAHNELNEQLTRRVKALESRLAKDWNKKRV
jgi:hypothetical protein